MTLLMLALACVDPVDTGEPPAAAKGDFDAVAVLEDDIPTVAWVTWETDSPGTSWVEYGPTRDLGRSTVASPTETTEHAVLLAGMSARSTWYWRAVSEVAGERLESRLQELETGVAPRDLPSVTAGSYDARLAQSGYTLTTSLGDPSWVIVFDTDGSPVWWEQAPEESVIAQVRLSPDGTSVLYNVASLNFGIDIGVIRKVRLDGELLSETRTEWGHHDFVGLPEGGYAYIAADIRPWTDAEGFPRHVVGDAIVEVPEGAVDSSGSTTVWSTWDHFAVDVDPAVDNDFYPQGLDWTHSNSLKFEDGAYALSVRKENAFVKIDRASGETLWQIGGVGADWTLTEGRAFVGQHSPELVGDDKFILFDNGDIDIEDAYSEAVEYTLDEAGRTYTRSWAYDYNQRISSYLLGDVERLDNGNTLIAWGSGGTITEVTPSGEMAFQVSLAIGSAIGFTHHIDALGGVTP
ncbi:MAG: aryl-sulfate sulfotransferase [Pseudomonadota bacterium]|nr:aryl-sulfate sulfotransferase [Pseudomonadota bacterium]